MSLIVLCAGGHASVVIEALRSCGMILIAATDRDPARKGLFYSGVPIIGPDDSVLEMTANKRNCQMDSAIALREQAPACQIAESFLIGFLRSAMRSL